MAEFVFESPPAKNAGKPESGEATFDGASGQSNSDGTAVAPESLKQWGSFRLLQRLGQGSFGEVYRAWDPVLEREIAVKLLLPSALDAEQEFSIIVSEARAIAKVRHPNIVPVYGVERRDGRVGFWSDYIRGSTLNNLVETGGPLAPEEVARIGATLCAALAAVHAAGLLHRDVKASNAMRDENGQVLLMDFGLSKELHRAALPAGTPKYMAPELWLGGKASVQSEIYALGVLLYFLAAGKYPTSAKDLSSGERAAGAAGGKSGVELPQPLKQVLRRAMETDPALRYPSVAKFGEALTALLPASKLTPVGVWSRPKRFAMVAAVLLVLGVAAAVTPQFRTLVRSREAGTNPTAYKEYLAAEDAMMRSDKPGNTELAISLYQKTVDRSPDFALAEAGLARAEWREYRKTSDPKWVEPANQASARAMDLNPNLADVQMTAGMLHVGQSKFGLGVQELQKALELDGRSAAVHEALGDAYRQQGRIEPAETEMQSAIDLAPDDWRWLNALGALYLNQSDFSHAESTLNQALAKSPDNASVLYNLGYLYFYQKRLSEARSAFERSIQLAPDLKPLLALASVQVLQDDYQAAAKTYQHAVEVDPNSWRAWGDLAEATQWIHGDPSVIADAYRKAIALALPLEKTTPDDPDLVSDLGSYYANLHEESEAMPLLHKALLLAPKNADVLSRVGIAYEILGRRTDAIKLIDEALTLGFSVDYVKKAPALRELRRDPKAPQQIRELRSGSTK